MGSNRTLDLIVVHGIRSYGTVDLTAVHRIGLYGTLDLTSVHEQDPKEPNCST